MIKIKKEVLEQKYKTQSVASLAQELECSVPTLLKYIKKAGIELKKKEKLQIID